jgi:tRNA threonylcarbamoyl adenosine modification protein (Sua5/YciO/YrdC/YwlC family)
MTDVLTLDDPQAARDRALPVLRSGGLVVAPTDTVYGVLADAFAPDATQRVFQARGGGRETPLTVLIRNPRQIVGLTADETSEATERLVAAFWPGPLTLVFRAGEALGWDLGDAHGTVAIRMPADELLHELIADIGPLASTGANRAGEPPSTTTEAARRALGERVGLYLDGGPRDGEASTVVDVSRGGAEILRIGAVPADEVVQVASGAVGWGRPTGEAVR